MKIFPSTPKKLNKKSTVDLEKKQALFYQILRLLKSDDFQKKKLDYIKKEEESFLLGWIYDNLELLAQKNLEKSPQIEKAKENYRADQSKFVIKTIFRKLPKKANSQPLVSSEDYNLLI